MPQNKGRKHSSHETNHPWNSGRDLIAPQVLTQHGTSNNRTLKVMPSENITKQVPALSSYGRDPPSLYRNDPKRVNKLLYRRGLLKQEANKPTSPIVIRIEETDKGEEVWLHQTEMLKEEFRRGKTSNIIDDVLANADVNIPEIYGRPFRLGWTREAAPWQKHGVQDQKRKPAYQETIFKTLQKTDNKGYR